MRFTALSTRRPSTLNASRVDYWAALFSGTPVIFRIEWLLCGVYRKPTLIIITTSTSRTITLVLPRISLDLGLT
jgi:hypothetical protein